MYRDGRLLWLRRRDNGKWTLPGGHLNPGEEPMDGAERELREETGFDPNGGHIETIGDDTTSNGLRVYAFVCHMPLGEAHPYQDPDAEAAEFKWMAPREFPGTVEEHHVPPQENVTLRLLGLNPIPLGETGPVDLGKAEHDLTRYGYQFKVSHLKDQVGNVHTTVVSCTHPAEYGRSGDDKVGSVDFSHMPDGTLVADRVEVRPNHQRRGVASTMYRLAQEHTGKEVRPSSQQTAQGSRFWQGMKKADFIGPEWRSPDGLVIPHHSSMARPEWDRAHRAQVASVFAGGDMSRLDNTKVPTHIVPADWKEHKNGRDRRRLYSRMVSAGDRLPPVILDHTGQVLDGKSRLWAARQNGLKSIDAIVVNPDEGLEKKEVGKGIAGIGPGRAMSGKGAVDAGPPTNPEPRKDYSHLLSPILRKHYQLYTQHGRGQFSSNPVGATLMDRKSGKTLGTVTGAVDHNHRGYPLFVNTSRLDETYRGKGLGKAMYEALYAHAFHHLKARTVFGEEHSSMAHRVHEGLAKKYGLQYESIKRGPEVGPNDEAYGPYEYALKHDILKSVWDDSLLDEDFAAR